MFYISQIFLACWFINSFPGHFPLFSAENIKGGALVIVERKLKHKSKDTKHNSFYRQCCYITCARKTLQSLVRWKGNNCNPCVAKQVQ